MTKDKSLYPNENFKGSNIPDENNELNTHNKDSIIKAINEIHRVSQGNTETQKVLMKDLLDIIGNWKNDEDTIMDFRLLGDNVLDSILNLQGFIGTKGIQRSIVFYIQEVTKIGQTVNIHVPYRGSLTEVHVSLQEEQPTPIELTIGVGVREYVIEVPDGVTTKSVNIDGVIDHEVATLKVTRGELGTNGISTTVNFIQANERE